MKILLLLLIAFTLTFESSAQVLNEAQGTGSGASITTGDYNTFYGDSSGTSNSSGSNNTFIGEQAGFSNTVASDNTFIGQDAGHQNTTGTDNVFIGVEAGYWNTATDNVFIGTEAGEFNTTGSDNVFIGEEAGSSNVVGRSNVFVGEDAGFNNTEGDENTFVGRTAGRQNTTGRQNAFFGNEAGYDNTTGYWNTAIGDSAGTDNSIGIGNTFIGHAAGAATEYASYNTFVGHNAGWDNNRTNSLTGEALHNTYIGAATGFTNREGNYNVGLGAFADFRSVGSVGQNDNIGNVFIGYESMVDEMESIAIGYYSRVYGRGTVAIGAYSDYDYNTSDYSVGLGWTGHANNATDAVGIGRQHYLENADNSIGIGAYDSITADFGMAIGYSANSSANYAAAYGYESSVAAARSMAFGYGAHIDSAYAMNAIAMGQDATVLDSNAMVLGSVANPIRLGIGTATPNTFAAIDLSETGKGFLINRLTNAERTSLGSTMGASEEGMLVYDTQDNAIYAWDGTAWNTTTDTDAQDLSLSGNTLSLTNDASTVDLSVYLDNTDTQLTEAEVDAYVANNGYLTSFTEVDGDATNEIQDISLTGTNLSITSGSTIDLSGIDTDTDTQLSEAEVDAFVANNGYLTSFSEVDGDITNELQDVSLTGNTLGLSGSAATVDLSAYLDNTDTQLTEAEVDAFVANNGYLTSFTELDGDPTNEIQDISLSGTDLTISSGSTIDLSGIDTDTDTQLSEAEVDAFVANNGYLTSFSEVDGDITNELQDVSLTGNTLGLSGSAATVDLSAYLDNTDTQLTEAEVDAFVANNGYLTSFTELDGDPTNEIQDISLSGTDLTISSGSTLDLSGIDTDTQIDSTGIAGLGFVAGPHTVDTDTDEQDLTSATLTGTTLQIEIENGAPVSVDLSPLLADLQNQINDLEIRVTELEGCACDSTAGLWDNGGSGYTEEPILYQNIPNPFNNTSSIKYYIPSWANSANLVVSDEMGKIVSNIQLDEVGAYGTQHINADGLNPGTYMYTLYVNQTLIDTKKMIVQ